jgi:hypothetical protein
MLISQWGVRKSGLHVSFRVRAANARGKNHNSNGMNNVPQKCHVYAEPHDVTLLRNSLSRWTHLK